MSFGLGKRSQLTATKANNGWTQICRTKRSIFHAVFLRKMKRTQHYNNTQGLTKNILAHTKGTLFSRHSPVTLLRFRIMYTGHIIFCHDSSDVCLLIDMD